MRTKTLLALAAVTAAGIATSMAEVYSVNAVGYVNVTVPPGFAIIANPLNAASNKLSDLIKDVPIGTTIYFYRGGYVLATYDEDDFGNKTWGDNGNLEMAPGEAVFIKNPSASELKITFVGEVMQGTGAQALVNPIPAGFSLRASKVPQSGQLDTVLGYPATENDVVYLFGANQQYSVHTYEQDDFGNLNWTVPPVPGVGQGFWVKTATAKEWKREFSVN